jgi:hypothetical protein
MQLLFESLQRGAKFKEVPLQFQTRTTGESKIERNAGLMASVCACFPRCISPIAMGSETHFYPPFAFGTARTSLTLETHNCPSLWGRPETRSFGFGGADGKDVRAWVLLNYGNRTAR